MNLSCILIPAIVGIICGILGYLIGKMNSKSGDNPELLNLQAELDGVKAKLNACQADLKNCQSSLPGSKTSLPFDSVLASGILGKKIKQDDLKIVEGIGPKIEELYHAAGINTWYALSQTSKEKSLQILHAAGERFAMHDPTTWAKQAEMAYNGKWQELKDWQDKLDGGRAE
jgi:predicted flap endonuclease-1-like 5' DNA nuclease